MENSINRLRGNKLRGSKSVRSMGTVVAWSVVVLIMLFLVPGILGYMETHYIKTGQIVHIDNNNNIITVEDADGEKWEYYADDISADYNLGDSVKMRMNTNYTDHSFYDDSVENVVVLR